MTSTICNPLADHATVASKTKNLRESRGRMKNGFEFFLSRRFHPCLQLYFSGMS
jgi:hypothetical protein